MLKKIKKIKIKFFNKIYNKVNIYLQKENHIMKVIKICLNFNKTINNLTNKINQILKCL